MLSVIGSGASKFLGVRRNFARILPNLPEKYFKISDLQKKALHVNSGTKWSPKKNKKAFHVNSGAIFFKSKHVGRHFCSDFQGVSEGSQRFYPDFRGFCPDCMGFFPGFYQIKTFGGAVAPPAPPAPPTSHTSAFSSFKLNFRVLKFK